MHCRWGLLLEGEKGPTREERGVEGRKAGRQLLHNATRDFSQSEASTPLLFKALSRAIGVKEPGKRQSGVERRVRYKRIGMSSQMRGQVKK